MRRMTAAATLRTCLALVVSLALPLAALAQPPSMFRGDASGSGRDAASPARSADALAAVRFTVATDGPIRATPVVRDDTLYLAGGDGTLRALDARTGAERWRYRTQGALSASPATDGRLVWQATRDGRLLALDARRGSLRWQRELGADLGAGHYWDYFQSSPVVAGDAVIVGSGDGHVLAFDAATGRPRWRHDAGARVRSSVAVAAGLVVFGTTGGHVRAVSARDGALRWDFATDGAAHTFADAGNDTTSIVDSPVIAGDAVVVGGRDGFIYALELATGQQRWRTTHDGSSWILGGAWDGEHVFIASGSAALVQAADPRTGGEAWRFATRAAVFSSITVAGDTLLFSDFSGTAYAVDRHTGAARWRFPLGGRALATPVVHGDTVYCASDRGVLFALALAPAAQAEAPAPRRVVAWQGAHGEKAFSWFQNGVDAALLAQFKAAGYEALDEAGLATLMREQRPGAARSVVVFADNRIPASLADASAGAPLVRRYLDNGGKIALLGPNPLAYVSDAATGELTDVDFTIPAKVFDIAFPAQEDVGGYYGATPTAAGRAIGLRRFTVGYPAILPGPRVSVLASDEFGRAQAWLRDYGGPRGSGLLQLSLPRGEGADFAELQAAIEAGISW